MPSPAAVFLEAEEIDWRQSDDDSSFECVAMTLAVVAEFVWDRPGWPSHLLTLFEPRGCTDAMQRKTRMESNWLTDLNRN